MPIYDYQCSKCGRIEEQFFHLNQVFEYCICPDCQTPTMTRIITIGHGGVKCDSINDVKWLPSALKTLQPDGEKPITSRTEYKRYLKEKGIIASG